MLVFLKNPKNATNKSFTFFISVTTGWSIAILLLYATNDPVWGKASFFFASFIFLALIKFIERFPKEKRLLEDGLQLVLWILPLFFASISCLSGTLFDGITIKANGIQTSPGPFYLYFSFFLLAYAALSFYLLISRYKSSSGLERVQLKYLFLGTSIFAILATGTNLILPIFGIYALNSFGPNFSVIMFSFVAYAIIKHRFMDIRMVVARSVAYFLLLIMTTVIYVAGIFTVNSIFLTAPKLGITVSLIYISIAVLIGVSFQPLKRIFNKTTDRIFFKNRYDPEQFLKTASHALSSTIDLTKLQERIFKIIADNLKSGSGTFALLENDRLPGIYSFGRKNKLDIEPEQIVKLLKHRMLVLSELETGSSVEALLSSVEASISVPLVSENQKIGILLLGEKLSGDIYSKTDLQVLEILAPQIALAVQNAKAYEEIRSFNEKLSSEVKRATAKLREAYEKLKDIDKTKDDFIYMASHQLRTPITASRGWMSMMLEGDFGPIPEKLKEPVDFLYQNAEHMSELITELLNVSRMNAGTLTLTPEKTDLGQIVDSCIGEITVAAKEKELVVDYQKPEVQIPEIFVDPKLIREVITNFLTNAVNYTKKGFIKISLTEENDEVVFKVTDSGIGVPEEAKKALFGKFVRAENAKEVRPDGNGLGLHLAKYVIEKSKGKIIFESEEGKGSTFGFRIPAKVEISAGHEKLELKAG